MGTTFVIIPKEEEAKNGLLQLVGELEFFFPDQVKVHDALALETGSTTLDDLFMMLRLQLEEQAVARDLPAMDAGINSAEDVWQPLSEVDSWKPLSETDAPGEVVKPVFDIVNLIEKVRAPYEAGDIAQAQNIILDELVKGYEKEPLTTGNLVTLPGAVLVCLECGNPLTGRRKKFCSQKCYQQDYRRRKNNGNGSSGAPVIAEETGLAMGQMTIDQLLEDEEPTESQVMRWKILSSGLEVNELGHLLKKGVLPIGEQVREKEKGLFEVVRGENGSRVLRRIEAGPLGL